MTPIEPFMVTLKVVNLRVVVAIKMLMVIRVVAARAIKEEKERCTGADVGRSAQRSPLRKKKTSGTPLTLRWLSFLRAS